MGKAVETAKGVAAVRPTGLKPGAVRGEWTLAFLTAYHRSHVCALLLSLLDSPDLGDVESRAGNE